jgi:hypothetical protein
MRSSLAEKPRRKLERLSEREAFSERPGRGIGDDLMLLKSYVVISRREEGYKITISGRGEEEEME